MDDEQKNFIREYYKSTDIGIIPIGDTTRPIPNLRIICTHKSSDEPINKEIEKFLGRGHKWKTF